MFSCFHFVSLLTLISSLCSLCVSELVDDWSYGRKIEEIPHHQTLNKRTYNPSNYFIIALVTILVVYVSLMYLLCSNKSKYSKKQSTKENPKLFPKIWKCFVFLGIALIGVTVIVIISPKAHMLQKQSVNYSTTKPKRFFSQGQINSMKLHSTKTSRGGGSGLPGMKLRKQFIKPISNPTIGLTNRPTYGPATTFVPTNIPTINPTSNLATYPTNSPTSAPSSIGLSTGGAKDIGNFRENIKNDYLPLPTDITYEGLFYDYYFDTGLTAKLKECNFLFCPSYSYAISKNPLTNENEYYLSVGLNSGIEQSDFKRKKLNLIIVLDISGSMSWSFDDYYYDKSGKQQKTIETKSKLQVANEAIVGLINHLKNDDRFGMVLFDDRGYIAKPLNLVGVTDMNAIKKHVLEIKTKGGTNWEAGYQTGTKLFDNIELDSEYDNRIIFLTDAMPNTGALDEGYLLGMAKSNAEKDISIHTTFIGVGVDFNSELVETVSKIKGCNYYSVHNSKEFIKRIDKQFEYMVTPLESKGYEIVKIYGSPEADESSGNIMKINTLFPSAKDEKTGETKGGLVLLKIKKLNNNKNENNNLILTVKYKDRTNKEYITSEYINIFEKNNNENIYLNNGIRKGILLIRYVELVKNWIINQRLPKDMKNENNLMDDWIYNIDKIQNKLFLSKWERTSQKLTINEKQKSIFKVFLEYFKQEMEAIKDETLNQEIELLHKILSV